MSVATPTVMQILVAWRDNSWVVLKNTVLVGAYAHKSHAMARAQSVATEALAAGMECYMLIRERDGAWDEKPCPKPARHAASG